MAAINRTRSPNKIEAECGLLPSIAIPGAETKERGQVDRVGETGGIVELVGRKRRGLQQ